MPPARPAPTTRRSRPRPAPERPPALRLAPDSLDDPFLLNRQFAARSLEHWLGLSLADAGYRFVMTPEERRPAIDRLKRLLPPTP
jgi:hypothetical protein